MFCNNCGAKLEENANFCPKCGAPVSVTGPDPDGERAAQESAEDAASKLVSPGETAPAEGSTEKASKEAPSDQEAATANNAKSEKEEAPKDDQAKKEEAPSSEGAFRFCAHCGAKLEPGATVCPNCHTPVNGESPKVEHAESKMTKHPSVKMPALSSKMIGYLALAAAAVILIIILAATHKTNINLNKYVTVNFDGYETVGTASIEFDEESFADDYGKKLMPTMRDLKKYFEIDEDDLIVSDEDDLKDYQEAFSDEIASVFADTVSVSPNSDLSNGDTVTITFDEDQLQDEQLLDYLAHKKCKLTYKNEDVTVDGLEEVKSVDPFADLSVTFSGTAPDGVASVENNSDDPMVQSLYFDCEPSSGLSVGDTVTVSISNADDTQLAENYGEIPSETKKTYTVEGLDSYVSSADDLTEDVLKKMKDAAEPAIKDYEMGSYEMPNTRIEELRSLDYLGTCIVNEKNSQSWSPVYGRVYLIYSFTTENFVENATDIYDKINTYYTYCYFDGVMKHADGSISADYSAVQLCDNRFDATALGSNQWLYYGYQSIDSLKIAFEKTFNKSDYVMDIADDVDHSDLKTELTTKIPDDALEYNGHSYAVISGMYIDWKTAKEHAESRGGYLAVITSKEEESFVRTDLNPSYQDLWLGASRTADAQNWSWVNGEKWSYTDWYDGEPSSADNEYDSDETKLGTFTNGQWNDYAEGSDTVRGYIIEWDTTKDGSQKD